MNLFSKDALQAIKSLFAGVPSRLSHAVGKARGPRRRVIEIEYRRRSDSGTRRSAAIHVEARGRRQRS